MACIDTRNKLRLPFSVPAQTASLISATSKIYGIIMKTRPPQTILGLAFRLHILNNLNRNNLKVSVSAGQSKITIQQSSTPSVMS